MKADLDLVQEVKDGNRLAFAELVKRHQRSLYRLALRFTKDHGTAEDVVQEAFIKAYQKLHTFEERSSFKSWLFRIAINLSKNKLRSPTRNNVDVEDVVLSVEGINESETVFHQLRDFVDEEVQKLPERQRMALSLRVFEELSFQEIAVIMDCPYDTAKANYRHAVLKLQKTLRSQGLADQFSKKKSTLDEPVL